MVSTLLAVLSILLISSLATGKDAVRQTTSLTGDYACSKYMCINATLTGDNVEYILSSTGKRVPGWMAVGFGTQMSNNPMVILWSNSDGSITLSQRVAPSWVMPEVVSDPPRIATLSSDLSTTSTNNERYVFTIPWDNTARTNLIWAFGTQNPGSSAEDAPFQFHVDAGYAHFDLSKPISSSSDKVDSSASAPSPSSSSLTSTNTIPLNAHQRMAFAHAVFCTTGFILFLPAGVLVSRWVRTFTPAWYTAHWILQFVVAGFSITIGLVFGVQSVNNGRHIEHLDDDHKKWGAALFALYVSQCIFGAFIHWVKPTKSTGRPLQNYLHAVTGLILIGLGFYQVRSGYKNEWPKAIGREDVMEGVNVVWYAWIVILPILYFAGLILLPKQLVQEAAKQSLKEVSTNEEQSSLLAEMQVEEIGMHKIYQD
ncbi:CBD9-like protein [Lentinula guzmanii]|uniref:CBD9-like protein n=1 Tax=Lentinula guzmanii TaxID=2804957 RepID=A0AA38JPU7_9AGAR|nr:CBD9-like protein [Lentinula guzmanii]